MIYLFYAFLIGGTLGVLSAHHTKLFVSGLLTTLVLGAIFLRPIVLLGAAASGSIGSLNPFAVYIQGFMSLPPLLRLSIYALPLFFFVGRLISWGYLNFIKVEKFETAEEKRQRIIQEHGWTKEKDKEFSSKIRLRR